MDINFELYKVFYHVAKSLSFSEASNRLYISQSAVSQSIKTLEEKINCKLFIRNTKLVRLTGEGEILFKHVEQAFNFIKAGERSVKEMHSLKSGEVRIAASDTICKYHLLPYFEKFNRMHPHIKIHVTNRTSPKCIELLKSGSVEVAVVNIPDKGIDKNLTVRKIRTIRDVFVAGRNFEHLRDRKLDLGELRNYPLLMLEKNTTTRDFIDRLMERKGISLIPEIELESVDLLIEMAKIGIGVSCVVSDYIEKELAAGEIFILNIKEKIPSRRLGVMTNNRIPVPAAVQRFIELLEPDY